MAGSGLQTLSGYSTFTGNVNITSGTLALWAGTANYYATSPTALGNMGTAGRLITVGSGAALAFTSANTLGDNGSADTTGMLINQGGEAVVTTAGANTSIGPLTLNGGTLAGVGGVTNPTYEMYMFGASANGSVSATGSANSYIALTSNGTATINGVIADGFQLATSNTFSVAGPGSLIVSIPLMNTQPGGAASLLKTGSGLLLLAASDTYTGGTTVSNGTLQLGNNAALLNTGAVSLGTSGTLDLHGFDPTIGRSLAAVWLMI